MSPERWQQVKTIFNAALELDSARRAGRLDALCAGDPALRAEVESLLAAHAETPSLFENPAGAMAAAFDLAAIGSIVLALSSSLSICDCNIW
jgi:hypothetical protein